MAYAAGDLILHDHYNVFATGNADGSANNAVANINTVWGTGTGAIGYGQTATTITGVTAGAVITATQWSTLIGRLNSILTHQAGTGSGITLPTAGATVAYIASLQTGVTNAFNNKANYATQGATVTGANFDVAISSTTGLSSYTVDRAVTFASADAARYFFNAGGQLNLRLSAINSADSGSENSFGRLVTGLGGVAFKNTANGGRTGSGLTLNTNNTAWGYRNNVFNSANTLVQVTDTTASYTASTGYIQVYTSSSDTTNGSNGLNVIFRTVYSITDKTWDDTMSLTYRMAVDIVYPETSNLPASPWGTPTVS
jgi:hypothetical protein